MRTSIRIIIAFLWVLQGPIVSAQSPALKIMTYNLRFGELASLEEIAQFISKENPDMVLLQEVDVFTMRERAPHQNGKNFISELAYHTGMLGAYCKSINYKGGYYGLGILSKYPMVSTGYTYLPKMTDSEEQRSLFVAEIELNDSSQIAVACTHLGLQPAARMAQVNKLNEVLSKIKHPIVLAGDFNAKPGSEEITQGMEKWLRACGDQNTVPANNPKSKIDYIFCYPPASWKIVSNKVPSVLLSDHLPVIAEVILLTSTCE